MPCGCFLDIFGLRKRSLDTTLDPRYGAPSISSPNEGAYASPHSAPNTSHYEAPRVTPPYELIKENIPKRVVSVSGPKSKPSSEKQSSTSLSISPKSFQTSPKSFQTKFSSGTSSGQTSPEHPGASAKDPHVNRWSLVPVHLAYISSRGQNVEHVEPNTNTTSSTTRVAGSTHSSPATSPAFSARSGTSGSGLKSAVKSARLGSARADSGRSRQRLAVVPQMGPVPKREKSMDASPQSEHSVEQWPGSY